MDPSGDMPTYSYYVSWSKEDKEFVATFLELPGLSGLGPTTNDAMRELNEALKGWLEVARAKGFEIPDPIQKDRPLVVLDRSFQGEDHPLVAELSKLFPPEARPPSGTEASSAPATKKVSRDIDVDKTDEVISF